MVGPEGTHDICDALFAVDDLTDQLDLTVCELPTDTDLFVIEGFSVERAPTNHPKPGYAYRVDDRVTIAGDTALTEPVRPLADGSDVLVHECAYPDETEHTRPFDTHGTWRLLADINVDRLLLTHLFPETEPHADELARTVSEYTDAAVDVDVATDHTSVSFD